MMWEFLIGMVWIGIFIGGFNSIFRKWREEEEEYNEIMNPSVSHTVADPSMITQEDSSPMSNHDWDVICRTAINKAKDGDSRARDWVMKNIVSKHRNESPFAKDAIDSLVSFGYKKKEAESTVIHLTSIKTYNNLEDLIKEALNYK
tara:strand:- start:959 stop:1396 length:438 start_codon:yes stop_codon:yes gene_type:complete